MNWVEESIPRVWRGAVPLGWVLIVCHQISGLLLVLLCLALGFASSFACSTSRCSDPTGSYVVVASLLWIGVGGLAAFNLNLGYRMRAGRASGRWVVATTTATIASAVAAGGTILMLYSA